MRDNWTGFYGPAYRLLLQHAERGEPSDNHWRKILAVQGGNPHNEGHWEFLALGYAVLFDQGEQISEITKKRLSALTTRFQHNHPTANWRLMARLIHQRIEGRNLTFDDLGKVNLIQDDTGFLPDIAGDKSAQYHAFLLFLIMRFGDVQDKKLTDIVAKGLAWLIECHNTYGDPCPLGRGRFQIFGYAAMAALAPLAKRWGQDIPQVWQSAVWRRLHEGASSGALSAHWDGPHRRHLLHGYNTVDDYPAFAALLTHGARAFIPIEGEDTTLWWNPLGAEGSGLVADQSGIQLCVLIEDPHADSIGMRQAMRRLLTRKPKDAATPEKLGKSHVLCGGHARLHVSQKTIQFELDAALASPQFALAELTLWSPTQATNVAASGSAEIAELTWQQAGGGIWYGHALRLVRGGKIGVTWGRDG